jgi:hypothetical protein
MACVAVRTCRSIDTAGVELTDGDADCAGPIQQRAGVVFEGVRQGDALRSCDQEQQYQTRGEPRSSADGCHGAKGNPIAAGLTVRPGIVLKYLN